MTSTDPIEVKGRRPGPERPDQWYPRFYQDGDEHQMLEVLQAAFQRWPAHEIDVPPLEHLRWKFLAREEARRWQLVVPDGGRIIGVVGMFFHHVKIHERVLTSFQGFDDAVLPEYQNRGVASTVSYYHWRKRRPNFDMRFGLQAGNPYLRRLRKYIIAEKGERIRRYFQVLEGATGAAPERERAWTVRPLAQFADRIAAFWREASQPYEFIVVRDKEYLNWRYCDPRAGRFTALAAEQDGRLLGYAVYRTSRGRGTIADLLALPGRLDVVTDLVAEAKRALHAQGVKVIEAWSAANHPYDAVLREQGLTKKRRTIRMRFRAIKAPNEELAFLHEPAASVHLTAGDTDLV